MRVEKILQWGLICRKYQTNKNEVVLGVSCVRFDRFFREASQNFRTLAKKTSPRYAQITALGSDHQEWDTPFRNGGKKLPVGKLDRVFKWLFDLG